ncbi:TonB-dependent receptor, partial [Sphingomonas parva]
MLRPERRARTLAAAPVLAWLAGAAPLPAQPAAQPASPAAEMPGEAIIVTASRRAETLHDSAAAASAFDEAEIAARSAVEVGDLVGFAPNASFDSTASLSGSANSASVFIRGIGQSDFVFATDPGVAVYVDGVYIARSTGSAFDLLDIARIEVLRGPQGTNFGRNAIGGAVALFTHAPALGEQSGSVVLEGGSFERVGGRGVANLPLGGAAAARVALSWRRNGPYARRQPAGEGLGGQDVLQGRAALRWTRGRLTADLAGDYATRDDQSPPATLRSVDPPGLGGASTLFAGLLYNNLIEGPDGIAPCERPDFPIPFCGIPGLIAMPTLPASTTPIDARWISGDPYVTFATGPTGSRFEGGGVRATLDYAGPISLRWTSAWRAFDAAFGRDPDSSPLVIVDTANRLDHHQWSHELQLKDEAGRLQWVAGGHVFSEEGRDRGTAPLIDETFRIVNALGLGCTLLSGATGLPQPLALPVCPNIFRIDATGDGVRIDNSSLSAFGEATLALTRRLSVTAGLRWTRDRKRIDLRGFLVGGAPVAADPRAARSFSRLTPRVIVEYAPRPEVRVYGSFSTGFKSGGFNQRYGAPIAAPTAFAPETVRSWELGLHLRSRDRRAALRATAFWADYDDIQVVVFESGIPRTINAAAGRSRGIELEGTWSPSPSLTLAASYGWLDTAFTRLDPAIVGSFGLPVVNPLRIGDRFVDSPRHSLGLS